MKEQIPRRALWPRLVLALVMVLLLAGGGFFLWRAAAGTGGMEPAAAPRSSTAAEVEARYGIQVLLLGVSAEGGLIDFRYRVTDPAKASILLDVNHRPKLIAEESGIVLTMHVRPEVKELEAGRVYFLLFANSQNAIRPGSLVTVVLDDLLLEHLTAQ